MSLNDADNTKPTKTDMLTKDLLHVKNKGTAIHPQFVEVNDPHCLDFCQKMLQVYEENIGKNREDLAELTDFLVQGSDNLLFAKSINKILLDNCQFDLAKDINPLEYRQQILTKSAKFLQTEALGSLEDFQKAILEDHSDHLLYSDLPDFESLKSLKKLYPKQLLERLNIHQVQGLLMTANRLTVTLPNTDPAALRRIFKFLKFFRLIAHIQQKKEQLIIEIDGPLSIIEGTRKYGLQIASFFPIICHVKNWQIRAEVKPKRSKKILKLDQSSNLVCHYQNMSSYIPEEVQLFAKHFSDTVTDWQFISETPFLTMKKGRIIFPDFTLEHHSGKRVYLEIFHRWHKGQLQQRLQDLETIDEPMILAIDRFLLKLEWQEHIPGLLPSQHFLFSDYPSVSRLQQCLQRFLQADTSA